MTSSQSKRSWAEHRGALMGLAFMPGRNDNRVVSVSSFGGISIHEKKGEQLESQSLFDNSTFDFRDVFIDSQGVIYAASRTGHLVVIEDGVANVIPVNYLDNPMQVTSIDDDNLLITGERGLAQYEKKRKMIVATRELDFRLTATSRYDDHPVLFDDQGRQHVVMDINELVTTDIPVKGRVTAFASSKESRKRVYGMSDGTIYLFDEKDGKITKLGGHLSRISKLKMVNHRLYSSSYDGTLKFWNTNSEKIMPMTLLSAGSWIMNFTFDPSKQFAWIGDQNGNLMEALLSVPMMADIIKKKLKSNLTIEEWNYFIGRNVPYETFTSDTRKEAEP